MLDLMAQVTFSESCMLNQICTEIKTAANMLYFTYKQVYLKPVFNMFTVQILHNIHH